MDIKMALFGMEGVTIILLFFVLIFSIGVVWRVEKKLDLSYKFFVAAIVALIGGNLVRIFFSENIRIPLLLSEGFFLLSALCFLISVLLMRRIVRELDSETKA